MTVLGLEVCLFRGQVFLFCSIYITWSNFLIVKFSLGNRMVLNASVSYCVLAGTVIGTNVKNIELIKSIPFILYM